MENSCFVNSVGVNYNAAAAVGSVAKTALDALRASGFIGAKDFGAERSGILGNDGKGAPSGGLCFLGFFAARA